MASDHSSILTASSVTRLIDDQVLLAETSLEVKAGQALAVLGENGAGKTTLLRILAGLVTPTHGTVESRGARVDEREASTRQHIASLLGVPSFYPDLTLGEQLRLINATWGIGGAASDKRAADVLNEFAITALENRFVHELSSGQTQLFYLASTFIRPSDIIILDEPEQRLDPSRKDLLVAAINRAKQGGAAVIFASHDASVVDRVADQRITLSYA